MIVDGDISNLAGRMPLGQSPDPREPGSPEASRQPARRWSPFWATVFVFGVGLLSWGAIVAVIVGLTD